MPIKIPASTPIRVAALGGLVCALGLGGVAPVAAGHHSEPATARSATSRAPASTRPGRPTAHLVAGLPAPVRTALRTSRTAVVVIYAPGIPADAAVIAAARDGARATGVRFAGL